MKVKVLGTYQIRHDGETYTAGDTVDAPDAEAQQWVDAGYAEAAGSSKSSKSEDADVDVSQYHTGGGWYEIDGERYRGEDAAREALNG